MTRAFLLLALAPGALELASFAATLPGSPVAATDPGVCIDVTGDQILGGDMARAFPAFQAIPRDFHIAPAPIPGGSRVFTEPELVSLGARFDIRAGIASRPVCFRVPTAQLSREAVMAAMRRALPSPDTRIELADVSAEPVPPGTILFPVEGLMRPASPDAPALWRGEVVAGSRHINIWARAKISAPVTRVVAVEDLRPGRIIQPQQIRAELVDGFPAAKPNGPTLETAAGMMPLRSVSAGSEIRPENLVRPLDVARGDLVQVEVRMGKARLSLRGRAEAAGRIGEMIAVRNPESNTIFRARIEGKDIVLVDPQRSGAE